MLLSTFKTFPIVKIKYCKSNTGTYDSSNILCRSSSNSKKVSSTWNFSYRQKQSFCLLWDYLYKVHFHPCKPETEKQSKGTAELQREFFRLI